MRILRSLLSVLLALPVLCSVCSITSKAADSLYNLSVAETRELFGDSLSVKLFTNGEYQEFTAEYVETVTCDSWSNFNGWGRVFDNKQWLRYYISDNVAVGNDPAYIQVDFSPVGTITDTKNFVFAVGVGNGSTRVSTVSDVYSTSVWQYKINGQQDYGYCPDAVNGVYPYAKYPFASTTYSMTVCPIDLSLSASGTLVTGRACFYGTTSRNILVRCPTVDYDASFSPGDSSGGDSGGGSSVDLTETNGILSTIQGWLSSIAGLITGIPDAIASGLHDLFVPSEDSLADFKDNMGDLFSDHFGALAEASDIIDGYVDTFSVTDPETTIDIPSVTIPLGDTNFSFGGQTVNVNPATYSSNFSVVMNALKLIIDIIATILVVNGLRNRFEGLLSGGESDAG